MKLVEIVAAIAGGYVFIVTAAVLAYWSNVQASLANATASAAINGVLGWLTAAGNWVVQALW